MLATPGRVALCGFRRRVQTFQLGSVNQVRTVMSNRQRKRRTPIKLQHKLLAEQRARAANPRPLTFTAADKGALPFTVHRAGPAQNLPVYVGTLSRPRPGIAYARGALFREN